MYIGSRDHLALYHQWVQAYPRIDKAAIEVKRLTMSARLFDLPNYEITKILNE